LQLLERRFRVKVAECNQESTEEQIVTVEGTDTEWFYNVVNINLR
jgi:hypothetical protein